MRTIGSHDSRTEELDRDLIRRLSIALRTAEVHERDNAVAAATASDLYGALRERLDIVGPLTVSTAMRHLFVNGRRVRLGVSDYLNLRYLLQVHDAWTMGGFIVLPGATRDEIVSLLHILSRERRRSVDTLRSRLLRERVMRVEILVPADESVDLAPEEAPEQTYGACIDIMDELNASITHHQQINTRRARRVTQAVVDQMLRNEQALLTLTTIKRFDDHLFVHSANVAILAVGLGQRIGLGKARLGELCLAALLHDLGKIALPREILNKPGSLLPEERLEINRHPLHSVYILLEQGQLTHSILHAAVGGFEHHLNHDLSGYPAVRIKNSVSLFGDIITIADRYDALTTPRSYRRTNLTPFEGILHLLAHTGTHFDPVLTRIFAGLLGLYPPGTVVGLDDGSIGVVVQAPALGTPIHQPRIKILQGTRAGEVVDLAGGQPGGLAPESADKTPPPEVTAVYNPGNRGQYPALDLDAVQSL